MDKNTQGLANVLASTTDQERAKVLAQESDKPEGEEKKPAKKEEEGSVKEKMSENEKVSNISTAFSKVNDAVRAAQDLVREKLEADPKLDAEALFKDSVGELLDIIKEMADDKDVFKTLVKEASALRMSSSI